MAKFYGNVGFVLLKETAPGVYRPTETTKSYRGNVLSGVRRWENGGQVNDNLVMNNRISIVADSFAYENIGAMKFVEHLGTKWKITAAEIQRPRIILSFGGVYNGNSN